MPGTLDAPDGDTLYVLTTPPTGAYGFVIEGGNGADGRSVWIANLDATPNQVRVEWHGAAGGIGAVNLSGKGDDVVIPLGDITRVIVTASAYPTSIGWGYVGHGMALRSGQRR